MKQRGRRLSTCYHEAGHCLVQWYIGRHFDFARVLTVEEVNAGATIANRRGDPISGAEGLMTAYNVGARYLTPGTLDGMSGDPAVVGWMKAQTLAGVEAELLELAAGTWAEARYRKISAGAVALMGASDDWRVAGEVLDLWYPEPGARHAAARAAERRASALVRSFQGWQAITAMARELLAIGSLEWEAACPMIEAAYGWTWAFRSDLTLPAPEVMRTGCKPPTVPHPPPVSRSAAA